MSVSIHQEEDVMRLSLLFTINAVIAILFGLGFVLIPATLLSLYAVEVDINGIYLARLLGAAFLGYGVITWLVRDSAYSAVRAIVLALAVSELIGFVISLYYQFQGAANALGWTTVAIYLLLGLGFAYFYLRPPEEA